MDDDDPSKRKPLEGHIVEVTIKDETDLQRSISHHTLTKITIESIGLEFESERTANTEVRSFCLLRFLCSNFSPPLYLDPSANALDDGCSGY